jgi:predicted DNA-binding transcriptional regulator AlpA
LVEEGLLSSQQVAEYLGITMNNLRQIQYRRSLAWVQKSGRNVYYREAEVQAYANKRKALNKS